MNSFVSRFRATSFRVRSLGGVLCLAMTGVPAFGVGLDSRKGAVTLFTEFQQLPPDSVQHAIQAELELIMSSAGVHFNWRPVSESDKTVSGRAVRVHFKGACNTADLKAEGGSSRPLGRTSVADGAVLAFIDIDCEGVRTLVQSRLWSLSDVNQERAYGRAVARVLAHELYHVLGNTQGHTSSGIGKASYSRDELLEPVLPLGRTERQLLRSQSTHLALQIAAEDRSKPYQDIGSLFEAVRQGDTAKLKIAINGGADINSRDADGNTLLMHAAIYATAADLEFLVAHGADVNAANKTGHTALMRALPDLAKVKLLVGHGADVNAVSSTRVTPLLVAASLPSAEAVVRYLIQNGANLKAVDGTGSDAVMAAAGQGAAGTLKILLDAGASGAAEAKNRPIPKSSRVAAMDQATLDQVRKRVEGVTALMNAARAGCGDCVRMLLEHRADAKAKTEAGISALHYSALQGNLGLVKLFLNAGAGVNLADDRGLTPLMMAANSKNKSPEVVRLLLDAGADTQMKDGLGRTAADWAQIGGRPEIVKMLSQSQAPEVVQASAAEPQSKDIRAAVAKSVGLLEETAPKFFAKTGCISCHNVSIPLTALTEARRRGYPIKESATQLLVKQTVAVLGQQRDNLLSGSCGLAGNAPTAPYALISLNGAGYAPDALTDGIARCLSLEQHEDGGWHDLDGQRPPLAAESGIPNAALAARAIKLYAPPALARDLDAGIARARGYLVSAKPWFGDDYAYRLLGLFWTEAQRDQIKAAARELIAQQRSDGGWAQTPYMSSDAYETGLSLAALAMSDSSSLDSAAYHRGVNYLMRTQESDGSWHVRTRAFGFQPYFESGFPHGHDQWISMAATAWSAMALMPAAEPPLATKAPAGGSK